MSTPFSLFRKHQRVMMAAVGILCMVAFTIGSFTFDSMSMGDSQNPLIATSSFGDFHLVDLQNMEIQRQIAKDFVRRVLYASLDPRQMNQQVQNMIEQALDQDLIGPSTERAIIESRILAELAKKEGLIVNDDTVTDFLRAMTQDRVTGQQFQEALNSMRIRGQQRVAKSMVYDALKTELLARNYRTMFAGGLQTTPAQRWDYYQRLKCRVRAEIAAVPVADFVTQVPDPGDTKLTAFFNEYQDVEPKPGSAEPAFKIPTRAAIDYFEAHYENFFDPSKVTLADVEGQYVKFKDSRYQYNGFAESDLDEPEEKPAAKEPEKSKDEPAKEGGKKAKPADKKAADAPAEKKPAEKKPDAKPAAKPDDAKSSDSPDSDEESSCSAGGEEKDAGEEKDEPAAETKAANAKPAETPATEKAATEQPVAEKAADEKPAGEKPTDEKPAAEKPAAAAVKSPPSPPPALTQKYALPRDVREGAKPKYEPFWKVEPEIRRELASERAAAATRDAALKMQGKLRKYSESMLNWELERKKNPNAPKPPAANFDELAKSVPGVTFHRLPLAPAYELANAPGIGPSTLAGQPFVEFALRTLRLFHLAISQDSDGNNYLFWKADEQEAHVPAFADARTDVLYAWRVREGRKLMLKQAETLAAEARKAKKSLGQALAKDSKFKVTELPAFSWMTVGAAGAFTQNAPPKLSEVPGVVDAGPDFMRAVFDLRVGDVGVAVNQPQTYAYVVRITTSEPPMQVLRDMFLADKMSFGYMQIAQQEGAELMRDWIKDCNRAAKLVWVRQPADERMEME